MRGRAAAGATLLLGGLVALPGGLAQELSAADRPTARAVRLAAPPLLDGEVLGDPAWAGVPAATGFVQNAPDEGRPSSQRTQVFVGFDDRTLYLGVVCHDDDPGSIIVAHERRDESLSEQDSFLVLLDTYLDRQSGFVFGTNPAGVQYDGQVTGRETGGMSSGNTFNRNWDTAWKVEAAISEVGWSAELAIPFRSLRFPRGEARPWGVNFQRNIRRRNENAFWAPLTRQYNLYRVSGAGVLDGVEPPRQRNLQLAPYALSDTTREGREGADPTTDVELGLDLKYGVTPSLTADVTYNTDFAQVEVDDFQINLDRFNLFFPEKRPFFLENAGLFQVGVEEEVELFFSRRIGLARGGEEVPIEGGVRLSGKQGRHNLGALFMRTEELEGRVRGNDFAVARYSRDLPNRSSVGLLFTSREGRGAPAGGSDTSRTYAVDGRWGIGSHGALSGFVARTDTPGETKDEHAFRLAGSYSSEDWSTSLGYTEVGEGFNPEVGFLRRRGYRKVDGFALRRIRPADLWGLHELRPHVSYRGFWNFDGFQETGFLHVDNHWEYESGLEFHTGINLTREGVTEPFEIAPGVVVPEGTYEHEELALVFFTNRGAPWGFEARATIGGFFGGDRVAVSPAYRFRVGDAFNFDLSWRYNDIDLPGGAFETNLVRLRLDYTFSPRMSLQGLIQYNDLSDLWASNLRFTWLRAANTGLFVVYNEIQDVGRSGTGEPDRQLIVKYSYLIDLLR